MQSMVSLSFSSRYHVLGTVAFLIDLIASCAIWFGQWQFYSALNDEAFPLRPTVGLYSCAITPALIIVLAAFLFFKSCMNDRISRGLVIAEGLLYVLFISSIAGAFFFFGFDEYMEKQCPPKMKSASGMDCDTVSQGLHVWRLAACVVAIVEPFKIYIGGLRHKELKYF